jgi:arabinogalactan oligomer/maltooligosaccharide transport system substrate-binding protein
MKRRVFAGALALGLFAALTGCSGGGDEAESTPAADTSTGEAPATSSEPAESPSSEATEAAPCEGDLGTLTLWVDETREKALADVVAQFKEEKCVTITMERKNYDDLRQDFGTQVAAGQGPDMTIGANDWLGEFLSNGVVAPITLGDKEALFSEQAINAYKSDGQMYGVPYAIENVALVRNNALLSETKATTFDELIAEAEAVGKDYSVLIQVGESGDPYHMMPLQNSFGAPVFVEENGAYTDTLAMGGKNGEEFAGYLAQLGEEGVLKSTITGDIAKGAFADGEAPYIITGQWNTDEWVKAGMDLAALAIPSAGGQPAAPFIGVPGFYLSAKSQNTLLAQEFLVNYVTRTDVQLELFKAGGRTPASLEAQADPLVADDPIVAGFKDAANEGILQPAIAAMNEVWSPLGITEVELIDGKSSNPSDTWDTMVKNIETAIGKAAE